MEKLDVFARFEEVADRVWNVVQGWRMLAQDTIGKQLVRAADSIGANLVEGDGHYSKADALHFFIIARGSARETTLWVRRAHKRQLITSREADELLRLLTECCQMLNNLITYRRNSAAPISKTQEYPFPPNT